MPQSQLKPEWQRAVIATSAVVVFSLVVGSIYWARSIFIPVALAVFFTFVMSPVVRRLERARLGRLTAVVATVGIGVAACGLVGWLVWWQTATLTQDISDRADLIRAKLERGRNAVAGEGPSHVGAMLDDAIRAVYPPAAEPASEGGAGSPVTRPREVTVKPAGPSWLGQAEGFVSPLVEVAGQVGFAFVLSVFMLVKREDLRNRLIRLTGPGQITTTTKAVDDASQRVSRYLFAQLMVNTAFGVVMTAALFLIGVPYAVVWGVLAAVMRYVPYLGTWLGLLPPVIVSVALSDDWWQPLTVVAVYAPLELLCNNVLEPWLYGTSMGLSAVAQIVAAAFWFFLWGPIGLVLSGPLTVCLLILGKYVPRFDYLEVLLGDEEVLAPDVRFYQRLTAHDADEAAAVLAEQMATGAKPTEVADALVVPALSTARRDAEHGVISKADEQSVFQSVRELAEELTDIAPTAADETEEAVAPRVGTVRLLALPARDEADRIGLEVFRGLLDAKRWEVDVAAVESLTSEVMGMVETLRPAVICIGSIAPGGLAHTRYLCKRLRRQFADVHIVVGRWGLAPEKADDNAAQLAAAGAEHIAMSFAAMKQYLRGWQPVLDTLQKADDAAGGKSPPRPRVGTPAAK